MSSTVQPRSIEDFHLPPIEDWIAEQQHLRQMQPVHVKYFLDHGVPFENLFDPSEVLIAKGTRGADGVFDPQKPDDPPSRDWFVFQQAYDLVYLQPSSKLWATEFGQDWALGQDVLMNPGATAFGQPLRIFDNIYRWLSAGRWGLVIFDWSQVYDHLRHVPDIAIDQSLAETYRHHMRPGRLPRMTFLPADFNSAVAS